LGQFAPEQLGWRPSCRRKPPSASKKPARTRPITDASRTPAAGSATDVIHGVTVVDPHRWLEDGTSPETVEWAAAQNARTRAALDAIPSRPRLHSRLTDLFRAGTSGAPRIEGGRLFSLDRWGDHDQAVLCVRPLDGVDAPSSTIVIDPARLVDDATTAIDWFHPSRDGRLVAYGMSASGDERSTLRIIDTETGEHLPDEIPHTRAASVGWLPNASAFAYTRYSTAGNYDRHVFWHELGTAWTDDQVLFDELPDPTAWPDVSVARDGRVALLHVGFGWSRVDVHVIDLATRARRTVIEGIEAVTSLTIDDRRNRLVGSTTLDADRGRVIAVDLAGDLTEWNTLVPESDSVIDGVAVSSESLFVATTKRAVSALDRYTIDGEHVEAIALPERGSLAGVATTRDTELAVFAFTGFARPSSMFRWTPDGVNAWSDLPGAPDASRFAVKQVTYPSTDDADIAMFIVSGADDDIDAAPARTILYGYGGFAVTMSPAYNPLIAAFVEGGGRYAVACIRGGAEEGEAWHRAGMREHKQQVFDDFHAAGDWLVANGITTREQLAIRGGSNGGLLVGAAITQRPDLCRAAICAVPLLDMVRFHHFLIAKLWIPEYGDPDIPEEFAWLYAYSPYHHVVDGTCYPATLIETGEDDSRVDPAHARKFAARLQEATSCGDEHPIVVRIEAKAGHGQGKPASRQADEAADVLAFLDWQLAP
jgi:prolyl oligopeptidase